MKRALTRIAIFGWYLSAAALVLLATGVSMGKYYFPYLSDYREQLLLEVEGSLPFGLEISNLEARWEGLQPVFRLDGIRLHDLTDVTAEIATAKRATVRLDILGSLWAGAPRLSEIFVDGGSLDLIEGVDGAWRIAGFEANNKTDFASIARFVLGIAEFEIRNSHLRVTTDDGAALETQDAGLRLENFAQFRRLRLTTNSVSGAGLEMLLESNGDPFDENAFDARIWGKFKALDLSRLRALLHFDALPEGNLSGELWAQWHPGGEMEVAGDLHAYQLRPLREQATVIDDLRFNLEADRLDSNITVWLRDIKADWQHQSIEVDAARFDRRQDDTGHEQWRIAAPTLALGPLAEATRLSALLPSAVNDVIADLTPRGALHNLRLNLDSTADRGMLFQLESELDQVAVSAWNNAPAIEGVNGYLYVDRAGGYVDLDSEAIELHFPRLFLNPFTFSQARARVSWGMGDQGIEVSSPLILLQQEGTGFSGHFQLRLPRDSFWDPDFALAIGVTEGRESLRHQAVPYVVSARLRDWLSQSIRHADVERGNFYIHRVLGRSDLASPVGMQLGLAVSNGELKFNPDWPALTGLNAALWLDNQDFSGYANAARIYDSQVRTASVHVEQGRRLRVDGRVNANSRDGFRILNESPIRDQIGDFMADWTSTGPIDVALAMDIPIGSLPDPAQGDVIDVDVAVNGVEIEIPSLNLQLADLRSALSWRLDTGLSAPTIEGRLWDRALRGTITSRSPRELQLSAQALIGSGMLARWSGLEHGGYLAGESRVDLDMRYENKQLSVLLESELLGLDSALPAPLNKSADQPARFLMRLIPNQRVELSIGEQLQLALSKQNDKQPLSGEIVIGEGHAEAGGTGVRLGGRVDRASAGEWVTAISRLVAANAGSGDKAGAERFRIENLAFNTLELVNHDLHGVRIDSGWQHDAFSLSLDSDALRGRADLPSRADRPFQIAIERIQTAAFLDTGVEPDAAADAAVSARQPADEYDWSALRTLDIKPVEISIARMLRGDQELGSWSFHLQATGEQLLISDLQASMPELTLTGTGSASGGRISMGWENGQARSGIALRAQIGDLSKLSEYWGWDEFLESDKGQLDLNLSWPGSPPEWQSDTLQGRIDFELHDGRLLEAKSNNPLMRALGALNFNELFRRLQFDFKDFYKEGLTYDAIMADIALDAGMARTLEPIELKGPSARMRLDGSSDLRARTVDGKLVVTLPLGSNLPWIAVLSGALPVAAGVLVASKLFEDQIGKFSSAVYDLSGSLDDPVLKFDRVFDANNNADRSAPDTGSSASPETRPTGEAQSP